jgi:hypothetical protein
MPRENIKGTSYLGLGLEQNEVKDFKKYLKINDQFASQVLRLLVRKLLNGEVKL